MARRSRITKSPPQALFSVCVVGPALVASVVGLMQLREIPVPTPAETRGKVQVEATLPVLPGAVRVSFGAFPREGGQQLMGHNGVIFISRTGLLDLSAQTGLRIRGTIVYLPVTPEGIKAFRAGQRPHYLADEDIAALHAMTQAGIIPRIALEPIAENRFRSVRLFAESTDVLDDIASTVATLGPCSMRIASELNLFDSRYHVPPTSDKSLENLRESFKAVHKAFKAAAPNVVLTFSVFIPNGPTPYDRQRCTALIRRYLPYIRPYVDMLSGTFYPHAPAEVDGLLRYADLAIECQLPLGIDELGCRDEETFRTVMDTVTTGRLGDLRYLNFFDYHVQKSSGDNTWNLKDGDKELLRQLRERGVLNDNADGSWFAPSPAHTADGDPDKQA
jgi:hypothetical protein